MKNTLQTQTELKNSLIKRGDTKSIDGAVEQGRGRTGAGMRPQNGRKQKWQNHERITKGRQQQGR